MYTWLFAIFMRGNALREGSWGQAEADGSAPAYHDTASSKPSLHSSALPRYADSLIGTASHINHVLSLWLKGAQGSR